MNKPVTLGLTLCVLSVAGLIFSPYLTGHSKIYEAQAQRTPTHKTKTVTLVADEKSLQIAPDNTLHPGGIMYNAMVFNGTIPGPVIAVDQGDTLQVTLKNKGKITHSLILQGINGPSQAISGNVKPGGSRTWTLKAVIPGVFLYYDGGDALNNVWEHISNGMYGGIVVHPANEKPAKEFYIVFGEVYNTQDQGLYKGTNGTNGSFDVSKFLNDQPDLILTNGMAYKYLPAIGQEIRLDLNKNADVFKVKPGELTRWYIVNAGPRNALNLNFVADMINGSNVTNLSDIQQLKSYQALTIAPGSASAIQMTFPEPSTYIGIDHDMGNMLKGAAFAVMATPTSTHNDQPPGTWVPPKGSNLVSDNRTITTPQTPFSPFSS